MVSEGRRHSYGEGYHALVKATVTVVARKGLRGMTFRAVAEEAGVKNTLITYHFGSREVLLVEAVKWAVAESVGRSLPQSLGDIDEEFVHALVQLVRSDPDLQTFHYEILVESRRNPQLRELAILLVNGYLEALERILRERGHREPKLLARVVHAVIDGMVFQELTTSESEIETVEAALALFVRLLDSELHTSHSQTEGCHYSTARSMR